MALRADLFHKQMFFEKCVDVVECKISHKIILHKMSVPQTAV